MCTILDLPESTWDDCSEMYTQMVEIKNEFEIMIETVADDIIPKLSKFEYR